jgi:rhodanese-related sulfurtransferase
MTIIQTLVSRVTADEVGARIDRGEPILFVDSRSEEEWTGSELKLPGAVRVEQDHVLDHLFEIPPGRGIVTYCTCPQEKASVGVAQQLMQWGFRDVHALHGGFDAWKRAGCTLEHKAA